MAPFPTFVITYFRTWEVFFLYFYQSSMTIVFTYLAHVKVITRICLERKKVNRRRNGEGKYGYFSREGKTSCFQWGLSALRHGIQNSMEAILACHPALSTKWLDWVAISCERWRIRTGPIVSACNRFSWHQPETQSHFCSSALLPVHAPAPQLSWKSAWWHFF